VLGVMRISDLRLADYGAAAQPVVKQAPAPARSVKLKHLRRRDGDPLATWFMAAQLHVIGPQATNR